MKTIFAIIAAVSLLAVGTMAFAHGNNSSGGWGNGHMGQGYSGNMMGSGGHMGQGYGGHMGQAYDKGRSPGAEADQEFLDKTADLRKDIHNKRFEYREAARNPETTNKELRNIEKEIFDIQTKIQEVAPRSAYSGNAPCWER